MTALKTRQSPAVSLEARFREVMPGSPPAGNEVWPWAGLVNAQGYGVVNGGHKKALAHRVSYELFVGPIPEGMIVRHKNDTPIDVNPANLELGTRADNNRDTAERGRWDVHGTRDPLRGSQHPAAKVDEHVVREIRKLRSSGMTYAAIGSRYGLTATQCCRIVRRKAWAHIE